MAGDAIFPLVPHGGEDLGRCRGNAHDEEGSSEMIERERRGGAGEVCLEPLLGRRITDFTR